MKGSYLQDFDLSASALAMLNKAPRAVQASISVISSF